MRVQDCGRKISVHKNEILAVCMKVKELSNGAGYCDTRCAFFKTCLLVKDDPPYPAPEGREWVRTMLGGDAGNPWFLMEKPNARIPEKGLKMSTGIETDVLTKEMLIKAWNSLPQGEDPPGCPGMIERAKKICLGEDEDA